jgi:hypothetical protein
MELRKMSKVTTRNVGYKFGYTAAREVFSGFQFNYVTQPLLTAYIT